MSIKRPPWIRPLTDFETDYTLVKDLVPVADDIRQLYTDFGLRPYRIRLVWLAWDSGRVGNGEARLLRETELLPTPRVNGAPSKAYEATGNTEEGTIAIDQISASYTEDLLSGLIPEAIDPKFPESLRDDVSFFYEIQIAGSGSALPYGTAGAEFTANQPAHRKRYHLASAPYQELPGFHWTVDLVRADGERSRRGQIVP